MADAQLNFTESELDKKSALYLLYKKLYDGIIEAGKVTPPDFTSNPPKKADGTIDTEKITELLSEYTDILTKNSAYLFAEAFIQVFGDPKDFVELFDEEWEDYDEIYEKFAMSARLGKQMKDRLDELAGQIEEGGGLKDDFDDLKQDVEDLATKVENIETRESDKHLVVDVDIPSSDWEIIHNLNKMPSVTVVTSAKVVVFGDVEYVDSNRLRIHFSREFSGRAILN